MTAADIAGAVSARTGIPVGNLALEERQKLLGLADAPGRPGHWPERSGGGGRRCSPPGPQRPGGSQPAHCLYVFTGPTGVGKTELCRALAQELYGSQEAMIRLDMTEYMEKQSVSRSLARLPAMWAMKREAS